MARKCTICSHKDVKSIDKEVAADRGSMRSIAKNWAISYPSLNRHIENCIQQRVQNLVDLKQIEGSINIEEEFRANLAFAKRLREAAQEYLSDVADPLKLVLVPRADEVEIVYYDMRAKRMNGQFPKKMENLAVLLARLEDSDMQVEKVTIKHVDMRKFALDAIGTADLCIDKFAKLAGLYQKDRANASDIDKIVDAYRMLAGASEEYRQEWLTEVSSLTGISESAIHKRIQVQQIEGVQ